MKSKNIFLFTIAGLSFFLLLTASFSFLAFNSNPPISENQGNFTITVDFANLNPNITVNLQIDNTSNLFDYTNQSFDLGYQSFAPLGKYIISINGIVANEDITGHYWIFYVNGIKASKGSSSTIPSNDDVIIWKFEKG